MKKSLIALAVMAAAGAASAQSSVTLFGIVDVAISRYQVSGTGGSHQTAMTNSGYNSSRFGLRGTEDLGGGMSASFWLEGALSNDNGFGSNQTTGLDFRRRSTLSLSGGWGELRLGRDYVPTFYNATVFDPFGTNGVGANIIHNVKLSGSAMLPGAFTPEGGAYVRADNMVSYFLPPNLGGVYGQVSYAFDERNSTTAGSQGRYIGGRVGYGSGPFNVAVAYGRLEGTEPAVAATPDVRNWNIGGQWDFGMARLLAFYDRTKYETAAAGEQELDSWLIGTLVPVGAGEIRASYGRAKLDTAGADPRANKLAIGYVHNLSKRTAVYATYATLRNRDGSAMPIQNNSQAQAFGSPAGVTNERSSGFDLGIRHSF